MTTENATYISLKQAAKKYGVAEETLLKLVETGTITPAKLPDGAILVAEHEIDTSLTITRQQFAHLHGKPIGMAEAGRKYNVLQPSITNWVKVGYIQVLTEPTVRGQKKLIDEADVAYCAAVYNAKLELYGGQLIGVTIFDREGRPYQVKYPDIATERRSERRQRHQE